MLEHPIFTQPRQSSYDYNAMTISKSGESVAVTASINYVRNPPSAGGDKLLFVTETDEDSTMQCLPGRDMVIRNARGLSTSVDREGFQLLSHRSAITDFDAIEFNAAANATYMREGEALVAATTGVSPGRHCAT